MVVRVDREGRVAVVTIDNPPVNAASHAVRQGLCDAVRETDCDPDIDAVVLACAGRTFVAGADIREFDRPPQDPDLPSVVMAIEDAAKPWVAAIHGTALGGGLELALGCSKRVAVVAAQLGLPEVNLGLIPGAGGTVRLPRLVPVAEALSIIAGGRPIGAAKAAEIGLVDEIVGELVLDAVRVAGELTERPLPARSRAPVEPPSDWTALMAPIVSRARGQKSPIAAAEALRDAVEMDPADALAAERARFLALKANPQSAALRYIFFAERAVPKVPDIAGVAPRPVKRVGVVGGGTMGAGIAASTLLAGLPVTLAERDEAAREAGQSRVVAILDGAKARGRIDDAGLASAHDRFSTAIGLSELADADLVVEAVFEDLDVKKALLTELDTVLKPSAVLASNTSYLDLNEMASALQDPSRFLGLHFFSPAHVMKLLEVICPDGVAPDVLATGLAFARSLGKIAVPAGVCDGFIGNRIMSSYRTECDRMLEEGAMPEDVDSAMTGFGFPMGIFAMQDLAGLDIGWAMRKRRGGQDRPDYVAIADALCEAGRFGQKAGRGWYRYDGGTRKGAVDPEVTSIIEAQSAKKGITRRNIPPEEIMDRILGVMQVEGKAVLDDAIAASPEAIDVVMVNGYGFPRWRGGPMFMAKNTD